MKTTFGCSPHALCCTLLGILSQVLQHPLPGLVPLVFASIVVLQGHLGVVERGSTQGAVVGVLQV